MVGHALLLCQWLLAPEGGNLMGETLVPAGALNQVRGHACAHGSLPPKICKFADWDIRLCVIGG